MDLKKHSTLLLNGIKIIQIFIKIIQKNHLMASDKNFVKSFVSSLKSIYKDNKVYLHEPFLDNKDIKVVSHCLKREKVSTSTNSFYKKFESQLKNS